MANSHEGSMPETAAANETKTRPIAYYIYEVPVRLWHWITALAIVVLCITGYFIGHPLPSVPGEAIDNFSMGYIRFIHFAAGWVLGVTFVGRIYWAFVGNEHARQIFLVPFFSKAWWKEVMHEVRWYLFIEKKSKKYLGHNPLAQAAMFLMFVLGTAFMIITGFALYAEGLGIDSWCYSLFGWVFTLFGNSENVHTWHHLIMWYVVFFVIAHVYIANREDIMGRQSVISTMISGWRMFKDDKPD